MLTNTKPFGHRPHRSSGSTVDPEHPPARRAQLTRAGADIRYYHCRYLRIAGRS